MLHYAGKYAEANRVTKNWTQYFRRQIIVNFEGWGWVALPGQIRKAETNMVINLNIGHFKF